MGPKLIQSCRLYVNSFPNIKPNILHCVDISQTLLANFQNPTICSTVDIPRTTININDVRLICRAQTWFLYTRHENRLLPKTTAYSLWWWSRRQQWLICSSWQVVLQASKSLTDMKPDYDEKWCYLFISLLIASVITTVTFSFTFRESALSKCTVCCYVLLNYLFSYLGKTKKNLSFMLTISITTTAVIKHVFKLLQKAFIDNVFLLGFKVLIVVLMKIQFYWNVMLHQLVSTHWHFQGTVLPTNAQQ